MASLNQRVAAELENIHECIAQIPPVSRLQSLKVLELIGVATLMSNFYHGIENILKQIFLSNEVSFLQAFLYPCLLRSP